MPAAARRCAANSAFECRAKSSVKNNNAGEDYLYEKLSCIDMEEKKLRAEFKARSKIPAADLDHLFERGELKDAAYALKTGIIHEIRDFSLPKGAEVMIVETTDED